MGVHSLVPIHSPYRGYLHHTVQHNNAQPNIIVFYCYAKCYAECHYAEWHDDLELHVYADLGKSEGTDVFGQTRVSISLILLIFM
jgi:hypothetical protein